MERALKVVVSKGCCRGTSDIEVEVTKWVLARNLKVRQQAIDLAPPSHKVLTSRHALHFMHESARRCLLSSLSLQVAKWVPREQPAAGLSCFQYHQVFRRSKVRVSVAISRTSSLGAVGLYSRRRISLGQYIGASQKSVGARGASGEWSSSCFVE